MDTFDRLLITALALLFLIVGSMMYLDKRNLIIHSQRIRIKLDHAQRLLHDVINISNDLKIQGCIENLECSDDIMIEGDESQKSIILEAVDLKDQIINTCL